MSGAPDGRPGQTDVSVRVINSQHLHPKAELQDIPDERGKLVDAI